MALRALTLLTGALFLLVAPGMMYNNASNSGLVNGANGVGAWALTCPGFPDVTCQSNVNVGCQASSTYCTLSGQTVSFLNVNSPFTNLIQGNILGLFTQVNTDNSGTHGPFDPFSVSQYFRANCIVDNRVSTGLTKWTIDKCTASNTDGSNMTFANSPTWTNWNANAFGSTTTLHFYQLPNATFVASSPIQSIDQINYTSANGVTGYTWYGFDFSNGACAGAYNPCVSQKGLYSVVFAVPYEQGALANGALCSYVAGPSKCFHVNIWVALLTWDEDICAVSHTGNGGLNYNNFASQQCDYFRENGKNLGGSAGSNTGLGIGWFTPIITFLIGLALLLVSLGLQVGAGGSILGTGTQFTLGANNPQGSRLAQSMGLGLLVWSPLYSEFSPWFTTGILPYGLDGTAGIMSLLLTGMFFFGIWWFTRGSD